jgi:hypothetical protein
VRSIGGRRFQQSSEAALTISSPAALRCGQRKIKALPVIEPGSEKPRLDARWLTDDAAENLPVQWLSSAENE